MDREVENIDINEKIKQEQEVKKKEKGYIKKKFKHLAKEEKSKKINFTDNKANVSYEGFYVQEAQKSIENKMSEKFEDFGINEMTSNIIKTVVDTKNKIKIKEKSEGKLKENLQLQTDNDNIIDNMVNKKLKRKKSLNKQLSLKRPLTKIINFDNINMSSKNINNFIKSEKTIFQHYLESKNNLNKENNNENNKTTNSNYQKALSSTLYKSQINNSNINIPFFKSEKMNNILPIIKEKEIENIYNNTSKKIKTKNSNNINLLSSSNSNKKIDKERPIKLRREILNKFSEKNNFLNISPKKKEPNNKFQSVLFFEQYFGVKKKNKNNKKCHSFSNREEKFKEKLKNLHLPFVNDKIIFSKGETEKLLNYEFYTASYKACCEIQKQNSMDNNCMKTNYHNNWNLVRQYTYTQKEINYAQQEKIMNRTNVSNKKKWINLDKHK